ncbi:MAG: hypothetical protein PHC69_09555, partial [Ruminiclostridium sp.]|nr:hypothetical protein [Ruminiclostridium sp.]
MKTKSLNIFLLCMLLSFIPLANASNAMTVQANLSSSKESTEPQGLLTVRSEEGDLIKTGLADIFDADYNDIIKIIYVSPQGKISIDGLKDGNYVIIVYVNNGDYAGSDYESFTISSGQLTHFKGQECTGEPIDIIVKSVQVKVRIFTPDGDLINNKDSSSVYPGLNGTKRASYSLEDGIYKISYIKDGENEIYAVCNNRYSVSKPVTLLIENGSVITVDNKPYTGEIINLVLLESEEVTLNAEDADNIIREITFDLDMKTKELVGTNIETTKSNIRRATSVIQNIILASINIESKENSNRIKTAVSNATSRISDALKTFTNEDDIRDSCVTIVKLITNVSELIPDEIDSSDGEMVAEMVKSVIDIFSEANNQISGINTSVDVAKIAATSMDLMHKLDAGAMEKTVTDTLKMIMESVIEKAGKQSLEPEIRGDTVVANFDNAEIEKIINKMDRVLKVKEKLQKALQVSGIRYVLKSKILFDIPANIAFDYAKIELPRELLEAAESKGIEIIE